MNDWTYCKDENPKESGDYIVTAITRKEKIIKVYYYDKDTKWWWEYYEGIDDRSRACAEVIAWKPCPEAFEENVKKNKWNCCKDEEPKESGDYIVTVITRKKKIVRVYYYNADNKWWWEYCEGIDDHFRSFDVIAWKLCPEAAEVK
jgi:hypothetical protein